MRYNLIYSILILLVCLLLIVLILNKGDNTSKSDSKTIDISSVLSNDKDKTVFRRATEPIKFYFPKDHGSHPEYQTEWWYFTGNLRDADNNLFGYQLTFFRRALGGKTTNDNSLWRSDSVYLAHFAITDVNKEIYYSFEKWSRAVPKLAGSDTQNLGVWIDDWSVSLDQDRSYMLESRSENKSISLILKQAKKEVLNGNKGLSQKSMEPGNASYYYSVTRLDTTGKITIDGRQYWVEGLSWFDHEWSTSVLGPNQIGWDWFSIQLDDNREIMIYILRLKDGGIDPFSSGTFIDNSGNAEHLSVSDFYVDIKGYWKSPETNINYPSGWNIKIPKYGLTLEVDPVLNNQEFSHSFTYWEGAVRVAGNAKGVGYVELTGY
jgi:predicted secreted hydrolase